MWLAMPINDIRWSWSRNTDSHRTTQSMVTTLSPVFQRRLPGRRDERKGEYTVVAHDAENQVGREHHQGDGERHERPSLGHGQLAVLDDEPHHHPENPAVEKRRSGAYDFRF